MEVGVEVAEKEPPTVPRPLAFPNTSRWKTQTAFPLSDR